MTNHLENAEVSHERIFEATFESTKSYADPFNDLEVDVIFSRDRESWRVPAFWRGGSRWTMRFAAPVPGVYQYRLESTDKSNPDLNGHDGQVTINAYTGSNTLLRHGALRVSSNKRYFEHADGTPFYWLGDTWWTGLSDRLNWEGFQTLTADRKAKGFTVVLTAAGLVPFEEVCPIDPGCRNEGGAVWDPEFKSINPSYFDYADRRIEHLIDSEIVPGIVGAWFNVLPLIGVTQLKKHWRYIIARYGAYPIFWILGGEVADHPEAVARENARTKGIERDEEEYCKRLGSWTEVARYLRAIDPYHHPLTVHEEGLAEELPLQDESLADFHLFQPAHLGWPGIAVEVTQLNTHYARTEVTKPLVMGEIGYERLGKTHLEDFQRVAFWLAMLNGAAGHTYGADGTWESYSVDKPLHRKKWSLITWEEGMNFPGSYQIGLGAKLLQQYPWWRFAPHPEWITPRGTTVLEPRGGVNRFHINVVGEIAAERLQRKGWNPQPETEWQKHNGDFRLPYAAGIPGEVRVIYMPYLAPFPPDPPTVLGLEPGVRYHAYYWEPTMGVKVDLGRVERPAPGAVIFKDDFVDGKTSWTDYGSKSTRKNGTLSASGKILTVLDGVEEVDLVVEVDVRADADGSLLLRFQDTDNYLAAVYSSQERVIYLLDCKEGVDGQQLGRTSVSVTGTTFRLAAEVRGGMGIVSITSTEQTSSSPIVPVASTLAGRVGLMSASVGTMQNFENFEIRKSPTLIADEHLEKELYDARGGYRGELRGPGFTQDSSSPADWDNYGKDKHILLDAYRPDVLPTCGDWVLVLETNQKKT